MEYAYYVRWDIPAKYALAVFIALFAKEMWCIKNHFKCMNKYT